MAYIIKIDKLAISKEVSGAEQARNTAARMAKENAGFTVRIQKTNKDEIWTVGFGKMNSCRHCGGSGIDSYDVVFNPYLTADGR